MKQFSNEAIKISVVIITRNRAKMLKLCLESLTLQTRMPDEVIVVDNASTDNTKKIITHYSSSESRAESRESREVNNEAMKQLNNQTTDNSSRLARTVTFGMPPKLYIRYVYEKQIGIPYARNTGIKKAKGTLILMLDDDCEADKFWVEEMIKAHQKYPKAWAIQGRTFSVPPRNIYSMIAEFDRSIFMLNYTKKKLPLRNFLKKNFRFETEILTCDTNNFSIKASYIEKHKLSFDELFDNHAEDTDFGKQIIDKNGSIIYCSNINVFHQERSNLRHYIEQHWHFGRAAAKINNKWKTQSIITKLFLGYKKLFSFFAFCKTNNLLNKFPLLLFLLLIDRTSYISGYFFEKNCSKIFSRSK